MRCCCCCGGGGSGGNVFADGRHTLCLDAQRVLRDIKGILVGNGKVWCNKRVDDEFIYGAAVASDECDHECGPSVVKGHVYGAVNAVQLMNAYLVGNNPQRNRIHNPDVVAKEQWCLRCYAVIGLYIVSKYAINYSSSLQFNLNFSTMTARDVRSKEADICC